MTAAGGSGLNVEEVFSTFVYKGLSNGSITNGIDLSNEGGMVWFKHRDSSTQHALYDTERGVHKYLECPFTRDEQNDVGVGLTSFNSDGFGFGGSSTTSNGTNENYVSWTFRKAPKFFDVVTYTGTGSTQNISHDLGTTVGMLIVKKTGGGGLANWMVYHRGADSSSPEDYVLYLNGTSNINDGSTFWGGTAPTSTQFTVATNDNVNQSGKTYVAYLFAHNDGDGNFGPSGDQDIIKCGSYSGQATVDLGFEPQWLMVKNYGSSSTSWRIFDNIRGWGMGDADLTLSSDRTDAELGSQNWADITPTGFKITNSNGNVGGSQMTYIAIRRGPMATPENASEVFDIDLANPGSTTITTSFPVDFSLTAKRTGSAGNFGAIDRLRGGRGLRTNSTNTDQNVTVTLDSMNSFSNGAFGSGNHVFYTWKRAPSHLDVVAYAGNSTSGRTVSHNLGVAPEMIWVKNRDSPVDWWCYHKDLGNTKYLKLNTSDAAITDSTAWNNTTPTDTVITLGNSGRVNYSNDDYIAYLFASAPGVSMVSSYSGNGGTSANGNGQDIDCGFSNGARFVLIKPTNASDNWFVYDTSRGLVAGNDATMQLNSTTGESSSSDEIDPLSSGFRILNQNNQLNRTGRNYIFYAIA